MKKPTGRNQKIMAKYFFITSSDEQTTDFEGVMDHLNYIDENEIEVFEAKKVVGANYFFCKDSFEAGEKGNCGKSCTAYKPRNGKNGICKHNRPVYEHGNKVKFYKTKMKNKEYHIKTVQDMIDCTNEDNLEDFLIDLKGSLAVAHALREVVKTFPEADKQKKVETDGFIWTDDGKHNSTISIGEESR